MLSSYRQIFAAPGTLAFSTTGFVSRLPISMTGIGIVTMLSQLRGSYGVAGLVSATLAVSAAVLGPQVSRLVDRHGQRRIVLPTTAVTVLAAVGLLLCARLEAPDWTLFLFAAGMGVMPSTGAMVRARWAHLYRDDAPKLHTAYSFEAVVDEICFIVGPILSIGLATAVFPEAGVLLAGLFLMVGVVLFAGQRSTEPPVHPAARHAGELGDPQPRPPGADPDLRRDRGDLRLGRGRHRRLLRGPGPQVRRQRDPGPVGVRLLPGRMWCSAPSGSRARWPPGSSAASCSWPSAWCRCCWPPSPCGAWAD